MILIKNNNKWRIVNSANNEKNNNEKTKLKNKRKFTLVHISQNLKAV